MSKTSLHQAFIETFSSPMKDKGFMRKGNIFHRIVNGKIVQLLSYYKFHQAPEFTIQFDIQPLCAGYEYSNFMDSSRLHELFRDLDYWEYEYQTDGYIKHMPEALKVTEERLFPLFDLIVDYKSYLENINSLYNNQVTPPNTYSYMIVNLYFSNYEIVREIQKAWIIKSIGVFQKIWGINHSIYPWKDDEFQKKCREYYRLEEAMEIDETYKNDLGLEHRITAGEKEPEYKGAREYMIRYIQNHEGRPLYKNSRKYIEQYIQEKEEKSLNSYVKAFTTPKKYETFLKTGELPFKFIEISLN